jgi:anti-sigma factor RsiW
VSEATPQTSACEQLLDYVYDMLDEAQKRTFEEHLATCPRCQAEAASFGRVRQATARLMPAVEPTAALGGALHAQLMHAASQRKASRGKLLSFPRKVMQHPAWAAAAMFVIVGSAITLNAVRGKLMMSPAAAPSAELKPEPVVAASPPASTASPTPEASGAIGGAAPSLEKADKAQAKDKQTEAEPADSKLAAAPMELAKKRVAAPAKSYKYDQNDDLLSDAPAKGSLRPAPSLSRADSGGGAPAAAKPMAAKRDAQIAQRAEGAAAASDGVGGFLGGAGTPGGGGAGKSATAKSSAPSTVAHLSKEEERSLSNAAAEQPAAAPSPAASLPAGVVAQEPTGYSARHRGATPPMPSAPAPAVASAPPQTQVRSSYNEGSALPAPKAAAPQQTEDLHQRADDLVRASRCDEAVKVYAELDRRAQRMSPKERANYVRCLTATGRQQAAEQQLDELKSDKSVTNSLVQQAEGDVQTGRRGVSKPKAAKKSPAAESQQQQQPARDVAPTAPAPPPQTQQRQ